METINSMSIVTTIIILIFSHFIYREIRGFFKSNDIVEFLKREGILCDTQVPTQIDRAKEWYRKGGPWADPDNPHAQTFFKSCNSRSQKNESIYNSNSTVN